ncbi:TetR/AcrR family transcriptional regulator [Frateuria aurantia]
MLAAAGTLAAEQGLHALTLDKVAERAGLTKGALQYHFKSRQGLIEALYEQVISEAQSRMDAHRRADQGEPEGAPARAYLRGADDDTQGVGRIDVLRVLTAHSLSDATVRQRYLPVLREWMTPDPLPLAWAARAMICRLAADGLWISRLIGYDDVIGDELMAEIRRQLEQLTTSQGAGTQLDDGRAQS